MKSIKNQYGKYTRDEARDVCQNCDRRRDFHTTLQMIECKRALSNSV